MELYTNDLVLRIVTVNDIEEVARMWEIEKGTISIEEAKKAIDYMQNNHEKNRVGYIYHACFAVFEKDKNIIIGWCGLDGKSDENLDIFYSIDANYRNKGFATQCGERLLSYAFDEAKVPFVNGGCNKDNIASYKVLKKIGMVQNNLESNDDPLFFIDDKTYHTLTQNRV